MSRRRSSRTDRKRQRVLAETLEGRVLLSTSWPAGTEFLVNTRVRGLQFEAAVAADAAGNFVVAWESDGQDGSGRGIYAQRYSAAGVPLGAEFRANTYTTSDQHKPAVAMDSNGDFIIAWSSLGQDGSSFGVYAQRYNASGAPLGAEFRVNTYTPDWQEAPVIAYDLEGNFVITWQSFDQDGYSLGIFARRYSESGVPQGAEFQVNTFTTGVQSDPAVAMDADGDFVITWRSRYQDGSSSGIFAQRYSAAGVPQGDEFLVNSHTLGPQLQPAVAMDPDGDFVIVWVNQYQDEFQDGVFAQRYNADGAPLGGELRISTYTASRWFPLFPAVVMDSDGGFVVAWQNNPGPSLGAAAQDGSGSGVYARRFSAAGVADSGEFRVNTFTTGHQGAAAIAGTPGGDFIIAWSGAGAADPSGVFAQRYVRVPESQVTGIGDFVWNDLNGNGIQDPAEPGIAGVQVELFTPAGTQVDSTTSGVSGDYSFSVFADQVAFLRFRSPAGYILSPTDQGADDTLDSDADHRTGLTPHFPMPAPGQTDKDIDAGFVLPASISGIVFNDRNGNGTRDPGEQGIPGVEVFIDLSGNGVWDSDELLTVTAGNGGYMLGGLLPGTHRVTIVDQDLWAEPAAINLGVPVSTAVTAVDRGMQTTLRDTASVAAGPEFRANTFTSGSRENPTAAMDADGDFVIVWTSRYQDGSGGGIYAQRYSVAGVPQGGEFRVNAYTPGTQVNPSVAMDAAGNFVVAWEGAGAPSGASGIWARRYTAAGAALGNEFRVNTQAASFSPPHSASIAMDADGDFVIAWTMDLGTDSLQDIYVRRYNASGVAQGTEFRVNVYTTIEQRNPAVAVNAQGDFVVAWESLDQDGSDWGVYVRRYNAAGVAQGGEIQANGFTLGSQAGASVAIDDQGNFVVGWSGYGSSDGDGDAFIQRYNSSGQRQGAAFRVNASAEGTQTGTHLAMTGAGDFIVTWASFDDDGSGLNIYARRFNGAGAPQGSEFLVNTQTDFTQMRPAAAIDRGGNFVIAWENFGGGESSVRAQRFAVVPEVVSSDFLFNSAPHRIQFEFDRNVSASLRTEDLLVQNLTTGQTLSSSDFTVDYDLAANIATYTYTGGVIPDGNYRATLLSAGIGTPQGAPLASNHVFDFFFLRGDANHDGLVNLADFNILAANFGQSGPGIDFTKGDFNYDSAVNLADFNILASRFGTVLSAGTFAGSGIDAHPRTQRLLDTLRDDLLA